MQTKHNTNLLWLLGVGVLFTLILILCSPFGHKASAAPIGPPNGNAFAGDLSNEIPNNPAGGGKPWLVVTEPGSNGMIGDVQSVVAYVPVEYGQFSFAINDACDWTGNDAGSNDTVFEFHADSVTGTVAGTDAGTFPNKTIRLECTSATNPDLIETLVVQPGTQQVTIRDVDGLPHAYYEVLMLAHTKFNTPAIYYANRFRFSGATNNTLFGYSAVNGNPGGQTDKYTGIAYPDRSSGFSWNTSITFALDCGDSPLTQQIYFWDTDHRPGGANYSSPLWQDEAAGAFGPHVMHYRLRAWSRADRTTVTGDWEGWLKGGNNAQDFSNIYTFRPTDVYQLTVDNINFVNSIQIALPLKQLYSYDTCRSPNNPTPSCSLYVNNAGAIRPGDRIIFNVATTNASGYHVGVNGPDADNSASSANEVTNNYIVSGTNYARGSPTGVGGAPLEIPSDGAFHEIDDAVYTPGRASWGIYATTDGSPPNGSNNLPPGSYPFNWGLLDATHWLPVVCVGAITVTQPTVCPNLGGLPSVPPGYVVDGAGNCIVPDNAPTVSLRQDCDVFPAVIYARVTDPDFASNPWSAAVNYSAGGVNGVIAVRTTEVAFTRPTPSAPILASAYTYGVNPSPPGGFGSIYAGSPTYNFPACSIAFSFRPVAAQPQPNDIESPTGVNFAGSQIFYNPATYPNVNGVTVTHNLYLVGGSSGGWPATPSLVINMNGSTYNVPDPAPGTGKAVSGLVAGNQICEILTVSPGNGTVSPAGVIQPGAGPPVSSPPACITITNKPYMRFYGNDVSAGTGFNNGVASCSAVSGQNIIAFARAQVGSGVELGAFANGTINSGSGIGFLTLANQTTSPGYTPRVEAFANTVTPAGNFGQAVCAADYWADATGIVSGPLVINGFAYAGKSAVYVNGDVTITGDITTNTSWANPAAISSYYLIVRGNIFISPTVRQLSGVYIAMPTSPAAGGRIYTCATSPTDITSLPALYNTGGACYNNPLVVDGAFIAQHVNFWRTRGSLRDARTTDNYSSSASAEVFRYSPELFMALPSIKPKYNSGGVDSILSLPPAL